MAGHITDLDENSQNEYVPSFLPSECILPYQFEPEYSASEAEYFDAGDEG